MIKLTVKHSRPAAYIPFFAMSPEKQQECKIQFEDTGKSLRESVVFSADQLEKTEVFIWIDQAALDEWDATQATDFNTTRDAYNTANGITRTVLNVETV